MTYSCDRRLLLYFIYNPRVSQVNHEVRRVNHEVKAICYTLPPPATGRGARSIRFDIEAIQYIHKHVFPPPVCRYFCLFPLGTFFQIFVKPKRYVCVLSSLLYTRPTWQRTPNTVLILSAASNTESVSELERLLLETGLAPDLLELMLELLSAVTGALEHAAVKYALDCGTLIGSYRHHCLIPWDDDLDILVDIRQRAEFLAILSNAKSLPALLT